MTDSYVTKSTEPWTLSAMKLLTSSNGITRSLLKGAVLCLALASAVPNKRRLARQTGSQAAAEKQRQYASAKEARTKGTKNSRARPWSKSVDSEYMIQSTVMITVMTRRSPVSSADRLSSSLPC